MRPLLGRLALLALGGAALLGGLAGALVLLGIGLPGTPVPLAAGHGILMSLGFLGTLIALERAVALGRWWGYLAPLASGAAAVALLVDAQRSVAGGLTLVAAATFVAMYVAFDRLERSLHTSLQGLGALAWLGAAVLLIAGWPVGRLHSWLAAFLILTIAGERLELSRLVRPSGGARAAFVAAVAAFAAGVVIGLLAADAGIRLAGAGMIAMAAWLARYDLARRTVRTAGVTRFVAASLLIGYVWLALGGLVWLGFGAVAGGPVYDAGLHAVFLGFVISMVFGHAPIILPAVLRRPLPYHPRFYAHLALLHVGLAVRLVGGDLLGSSGALAIGGVLNVLALLLFVVNSVAAVVRAPSPAPAPARAVAAKGS